MIAEYIQPILIVSGVATMGGIVQFFTPRAILRLMYDVKTSENPSLGQTLGIADFFSWRVAGL
jgi:hypothetical protein